MGKAKGWRFTPTLKGTGQRLDMTLSDEDHMKIGRGYIWRATVTNQDDGKRYKARGASCGLPRCLCDAVVEEITDHKQGG